MKSHIRVLLLSSSVLSTISPAAAAQEMQPSPDKVSIAPGSDLRCRLEKSLRVTRAGEPVTARVIEPLYSGTVVAVPEGSTLKGHISSVTTLPWTHRTGRLLSGDFSPPRIAGVAFDQLVLPDGTMMPIHTGVTVGLGQVQTTQFLPKGERPGVREKIKDATKPFREPHKLQRLGEAVVTSLPYHPEYLHQGTVFDATLTEAITAPVAPASFEVAHRGLGENYLHLRLLTPLTSQAIAHGAPIQASVCEPYYNSEHVLLYPAGTMVEGAVTKATSARWMKKNGGLLFSFHSAQTPDGTTTEVDAVVAALETGGDQHLRVGQEGDVKATTSLFTQLRAPVSLIAPSRSAADPSLNKTAWSRASQGNNGWGLLGAGAAQASAETATGFGYFGAAKQLYATFVAKGSDVELPLNTPIYLRVHEKPALKAPAPQAAAGVASTE